MLYCTPPPPSLLSPPSVPFFAVYHSPSSPSPSSRSSPQLLPSPAPLPCPCPYPRSRPTFALGLKSLTSPPSHRHLAATSPPPQVRKGQWRLASTLCGEDPTYRSLLVEELIQVGGGGYAVFKILPLTLTLTFTLTLTLIKAGSYTEANSLHQEWGLPPIDTPAETDSGGGGAGEFDKACTSHGHGHYLSLADCLPGRTHTSHDMTCN